MADTPRPEFEPDEAIQTEKQKVTFGRIKGLGFSRAADDVAPDPRTLTEKRIDEIVNLMRHGEWEAGKSDDMLANLWGLASASVRGLATEANRIIRREVRERFENKDALLDDLRGSFARLAAKAERLGTAHGLKVAQDGLDRLADYTGLKPALKVETNKDPFAGWTDEELALYSATGKKPARAK